MTPPTTLLDRVRLRLRSRRAIEAERDDAVANALGWRRSAERWRDELDQVGAVLCEHGYHAHEGWGVLASDVRDALRMVRAQHGRDVDAVADALGVLTGPGIDLDVTVLVAVVRAVRDRARVADRDRTAAHQIDQAIADAQRVLRTAGHEVGDETSIGDDVARAVAAERDRADLLALTAEESGGELDAIRDELRATGHQVGDPRGLSYDVDIAIDTERERGQDLVERLAEILGWRGHSSWPHAAPHLVRAVAMRLGQAMPRRSSARAWPVGSSMARALACTCRGERGYGPTSIVDSRCPEHSRWHRFGGRPARPLALPPAVSLWVIDPADGWRPLGWRDEVPF